MKRHDREKPSMPTSLSFSGVTAACRAVSSPNHAREAFLPEVVLLALGLPGMDGWKPRGGCDAGITWRDPRAAQLCLP
jgi:hypothetical protein